MKKLIAIVCVVMIFATLLAGCAKTTECEVCGETKKCKQLEYEGEKGWFCVDGCYEKLEAALELAEELEDL